MKDILAWRFLVSSLISWNLEYIIKCFEMLPADPKSQVHSFVQSYVLSCAASTVAETGWFMNLVSVPDYYRGWFTNYVTLWVFQIARFSDSDLCEYDSCKKPKFWPWLSRNWNGAPPAALQNTVPVEFCSSFIKIWDFGLQFLIMLFSYRRSKFRGFFWQNIVRWGSIAK